MESQQELIVQAAMKLFEQFGIRGVSIDSVCGELRISKKTFYTYFPQKEELVDAVLTYQRKSHQEKFKKLLKNKNAIDSLIISIQELRKNISLDNALFCNDLEKYYPKLNEKHESIVKEEMSTGFEYFLRQGIDEGYFRADMDVELIALYHAVQTKYTFQQLSKDSKKFSRKRIFDFYIDLLVHLIANESGLRYLEKNYYNSDVP